MSKIRTSYGIDVISGKVGQAVFSNEQDGVGMRSYNPVSKQPFTPAQVSIEANFTKAAKAWVTLAPATAAQWKAFALTQKVKNPLTGKYRTKNGRQAFVGFYAKMLQASPASGLPAIPSGSFVGDAITLTAVPSASKVTITASAANSANVVTEILTCRLPSANAIPDRAKLRTLMFFPFATGSLTFNVNATAGTWFYAYRFVNKLTGQETGLVELPLQTVTLSLEDGGLADEASSDAMLKAA